MHTRINILNKLNLKCNKRRYCNMRMIEVKSYRCPETVKTQKV